MIQMRFLNKILYTAIVLFCSIHISVGQRGGATNPTISVETVVTHLTNEISSGEIEYEVTVSTGWVRGTQINSLEILDSDGQTVYEHPDSGPTGVVSSLSIGSYKFTGSITVKNSSGYFVSVYFNHTVWVGLEAKWCDSKDMNIAFDNTITRNTSILNYAGARSNNILQTGDGWVQLNAIYGSGEDSKSFLVLGNTQDLSNFSPSGSFQYIEFYSTESESGIRVNYQSSPGVYSMTTISNNPNDVVRLIRKNGSVEIELNNDISSSFSFPANYSGILNIGVFSNEIGDGFQNVVTSMPGGSILASWDGDLNTGIINVDISDLEIDGPYSFYISDEQNSTIDPTYLFNYLSDSLGFNVSNNFFDGTETESTSVFSDLADGDYFITVFNNNGDLIFKDAQYVSSELTFESSQGLEQTGGVIKVNSSSGLGTVELYAKSDENSELIAEIEGNSKDLFFGISESSSTVNSYSDIDFGFQVISKKLFLIESGVRKSSSYSFDSKVEIKIKISNNLITLSSSLGDNSTFSAQPNSELQVSTGLSYGGQISIGSNSFKKKVFNVITNVHSNLDCSGLNEPSFSFSVTRPGTSPVGMSYSLKDEDGNVLLSNISGLIQSSYLVNTSAVGQPLTAGVYTVYGTVSGGGSFSQDIYLGYETLWHIREDYYVETPNTYSVEVQNSPETDYSLARSENILKFNEEGWIEFTPVTDANNGPNIFRFTTLNINGTPNQLGLFNEDFIVVTTNSTGTGAVITPYSSQSGWQTPIYTSKNARVRLIFNTNVTANAPYGSIEVFVHNQYKDSFNRGNSSIISRVNSMKNSDGFKDIVSSFGCTPPQDIHAHLKYELDGYYHIMKGGKLLFVYDNEYNTHDLEYKIYNIDNDVVRTNLDYSPVTMTNGLNYVSIDVKGSNCINKGFFYMEVTNSKKEKFYLRFFNDYVTSPCYDNTIDENQNQNQ